MWIAAAGALATVASAAALVVVIVTGLEYDSDNGLLDPFAPVWRPAALLAFSIAWPVPVFSGRRWARWAAAMGLALGAAWLLFLADLDPRWLTAAFATAVCWAAGALGLALPPSVGAFSTYQRAQAASYARFLGALSTEQDARRWIAAVRAWDESGVLSRRDRSRIAEALRVWASAQSALDDALGRAIDAVGPVSRNPEQRFPIRLWRRRGPVESDPPTG
ncbi:MAG: hypothetical protein IH616_17270 [Gemmatimonadales bacterium]|jgi:hypothetical protein|nr:hypothetical protein [Gemmatimonadales bacterium]